MKSFLLLQVRDADDPMREQEVGCFARALQCDHEQIDIFDLLSGVPTVDELNAVDVVLLGGSGAYSVAAGGDWLAAAMEAMQELYELGKPTFASCWGFQAMARAMGGEVITDIARAEVGSVPVQLTEAGKQDALFASLGDTFIAPMGHQDIVVRLPPKTTLLASSEKVENQAFRFNGKPIYCTQFHPELDRQALSERLTAYPQYAERILGRPFNEVIGEIQETEQTNLLLGRFVQALRDGAL